MRKYIIGIFIVIVILFLFLWISPQRERLEHAARVLSGFEDQGFEDQEEATSPDRNHASPELSYGEFGPPGIDEYPRGASVLIHGRIRDEEGASLSDATITLFASRLPFPSLEFNDPVARSNSGEHGFYELPLDFSVSGWIVVEKPGFATIEEHVDLEQAGTFTKNYVLVSAPAALSGTVFDDEGNPISGAAAFVSFPQIATMDRNDEITPRGARTDRQGEFELVSLPEQEASVIVSAEGFLPSDGRMVNLNTTKGTHLTFTLKRGKSVTLAVKDEKGESIAFPAARGPGGFAVRGNREGEVTLTVPVESTFQCEVSARGYLSRNLLIDPSISSQTVVLEPGLLVEGRVSSTRGYPIKDAEITVFDNSSGRERFVGFSRSDQSGHFVTQISAEHVSRLRIAKQGFVEKTIAVEKDQVSKMDIVLEPGSAGIYGRVVDSNGAPIENFVIVLRVKGHPEEQAFVRSFADELGRFAILDLPAETLTLTAIHPSSGSRETVAEVKTISGTLHGELIIKLEINGR